MDNTLYVALSKQMVLRRELDIVANNIANADTTGFKVESLMESARPSAPAFTLQGPRPVKFVGEDGVGRDFGQGSLRQTGASLDLGIEGRGFFQVTTANGPRYTRDGRFQLDGTGKVVTEAGDPVLDDGGGEITLNPQDGPVLIAEDGSISQGSSRVGKIGVVNFTTLATLQKVGDNLYRNTSNQSPEAAASVRVRQGMLEGSNVKPIEEITKMIEVNRAYERISRMMDSTSELARTAVSRMGRVQ